MKNISADSCVQNTQKGRRVDKDAETYFEEVCLYLENCAEVLSLQELYEKMKELADNAVDQIYSAKWMKTKLKKKYGDHIFFSEVNGKPNVICFKDMASYIINEKWYENKKENVNDEKERIITTATKLILNDLRQSKYDTSKYPSVNDIKSTNIDYLPLGLQLLVKNLILSPIKQASIGQCILKATKERSVIPPLMFGLAIEMDSVFGSKWLINELYKLGFCVSYDEVLKYKQTVLKATNVNNILSPSLKGCFTQWVGDNIDHNIRTLDGKNTFHGMGVIAISTPSSEIKLTEERHLERPKTKLKIKDLIAGKGVQIHHYDFPKYKGLANIKFTTLSSGVLSKPLSTNNDMLWQAAALLNNNNVKRPNWSGFMQHVSRGAYPRKSHITLLPIIDLNPSDYSCIYSVLLYIESQAKMFNIPTPCITFDQPLYIKAMEIILAKEMNIVCRLGGFHTLMSFLGSVGDLMAGSGIEEALQEVYGSNAVSHMMSGKAIARALRGHILIDCALKMLLIEEIFSDNTAVSIELQNMFDSVMNEKITESDVENSKVLSNLKQTLQSKNADLSKTSRTAKLWIRYCNYIDIVKQFIRAERISDWKLHLESINKMLNLFAATGRFHYTKSARLYLQTMMKLPEKYPWLYNQLAVNKLFSVRRSSHKWAGLWTDLSIEQILMKSIKSRGGLTRGRGMTESTRLVWVYSIHACAEFHQAMTSLTKTTHITSEQHVEMHRSRCSRDTEDLMKIKAWFSQHNPFDPNETQLKSLATGLVDSNGNINCDEAEKVGQDIHNNLDGICFEDVAIKRADRVTTLSSLNQGITIENKHINIDPLVLFTRLVLLLDRSEEKEKYFQYELTPVPTALFKNNFMRKPNKANLADHLLTGNLTSSSKRKSSNNNVILKNNSKKPKLSTQVDSDKDLDNEVSTKEHEQVDVDLRVLHVVPNNSYFVLDGGAVLHRVVWRSNASYREVVQQYQNYIQSKYGICSIVFDGYGNCPSTKDHEHKRRSLKGKSSPNIFVQENISAYGNQHAFLSNDFNKKQFIKLLEFYLFADGHTVEIAPGDADTLIVEYSLKKAESSKVIVVADDTDIFIMLLHFYHQNYKPILMLRESKGKEVRRLYNIKEVASNLEKEVLAHILAIHAWSGCDTTSALYGIGKVAVLKLVSQSPRARSLIAVLSDENASRKMITDSGINLAALTYGGKNEETLACLRYSKFMKMASSSSKVLPEKLPPTDRAIVYHTWRVHLQVRNKLLILLDC